jgi:uncharacterized membrane protein
MAAQAKSSAGDDSKIFAVIAYLLGIIGFLIVLLAKKDNKFAMYHAKQSLVLFILAVILWIPGMILSVILAFIPFGFILSMLMWLVIWVCILALVVVGIINAVNMQTKPLPVIGKFGEKFNF